jgi:hypothetical protein
MIPGHLIQGVLAAARNPSQVMQSVICHSSVRLQFMAFDDSQKLFFVHLQLTGAQTQLGLPSGRAHALQSLQPL